MKHVRIHYNNIMDLQLLYVDTNGMILSMKAQSIIKVSENLEDLFNFSNLDENHELFSKKNRKRNGKFKMETPKKVFG